MDFISNIYNFPSNIYNFILNIYNALKDPKTRNIFLYLFVTLCGLVLVTAPKFGFGFDPLKISPDIGGLPEIYFYLGYVLIYIILTCLIIYNRIDRCIIEYRKRDPKYEKYSAWDFVSNNVSDVLYDAYNKTIWSILKPFVIFIIVTIIYLGVNNASKIAKPLLVGTVIVNYGMAIIVPIINIVLFILYFLTIDSNTPC
jgi:hypothetical protein